MKLATTFAGLTLAVAAAYSTPAVSQDIHANSAQPAARCQGALPNFEVGLRKRPLAVQNVGTTAMFVTCGFDFDAYEAIDNTALLVDTYFTNTGTEPATVTCTAVAGFEGGVTENVNLAIEIPAGAGGEDGNLYVFDTDFESGSMATGLVAFSCRLPAGVGINDTYVYWATE
ncbi:hypothetical protein [Luteimonas arsenica]|uniref:hypothetical protein n=1 Tax=Luteimonas arsenica TaxID=1586242 RepID=UPI001055AEE9|nr:hypothetical protein [Luteimonas arsenica]